MTCSPRGHLLRERGRVPCHVLSREPIRRKANGHESADPRQIRHTSTALSPTISLHVPQTQVMAEFLPSSPKAATNSNFCSASPQPERVTINLSRRASRGSFFLPARHFLLAANAHTAVNSAAEPVLSTSRDSSCARSKCLEPPF